MSNPICNIPLYLINESQLPEKILCARSSNQ